jgi:1-acyl-sn-glycerol-3-phosphate acyltransferase
MDSYPVMTAYVLDIFRKLHLPTFNWRHWLNSKLAWRKRWNPEPFYRLIAKSVAVAIYNPKYTGFEQIPATGPAILICNHVSYVDGLIIAAGCNRAVRFIIDTHIYSLPLVHYFMRYNRAIPILPTRESVTNALEEISAGLKAGDLICIFPEGQMTYTGGLGRFKPGIEAMVKRDPVPVYPIALTGLWGSVFSRKFLGSFKRYIPKKSTPRVHAICGAPIEPTQVTINGLQEKVLRLKYLANAN